MPCSSPPAQPYLTCSQPEVSPHLLTRKQSSALTTTDHDLAGQVMALGASTGSGTYDWSLPRVLSRSRVGTVSLAVPPNSPFVGAVDGEEGGWCKCGEGQKGAQGSAGLQLQPGFMREESKDYGASERFRDAYWKDKCEQNEDFLRFVKVYEQELEEHRLRRRLEASAKGKLCVQGLVPRIPFGEYHAEAAIADMKSAGSLAGHSDRKQQTRLRGLSWTRRPREEWSRISERQSWRCRHPGPSRNCEMREVGDPQRCRDDSLDRAVADIDEKVTSGMPEMDDPGQDVEDDDSQLGYKSNQSR